MQFYSSAKGKQTLHCNICHVREAKNTRKCLKKNTIEIFNIYEHFHDVYKICNDILLVH